MDRAGPHGRQNVGNAAERDHRDILWVRTELFQRRAYELDRWPSRARDADPLALEIGTFSYRGVGEQGEDHLVPGCADPDKVCALRPRRHHRRRRKVAKLDLAGEKRLHGGGAAADVDQIGIEPVFP